MNRLRLLWLVAMGAVGFGLVGLWGAGCSQTTASQDNPVGKEATGEKSVVGETRSELVPDAAQEAVPEKEPGEAKVEQPATVCRTPKGLGSGPYFRDITAQMGLGEKGLPAYGTRLSSADLDHDGYPDLVIHGTGSHARDDLNASPPKRYRWILLNRPDPKEPTRRIFVDHTKASGYLTTDDGKNGRVSHFAIFGDVNNDGHVDMLSAVYVDATKPDKDSGDRTRILLGDGKGGFALAPSSALAFAKDQHWPTTAATFLDYNRDGILDVFVGFWYQSYGRSYEGLQDRLYQGKGDGTFADVTAAAKLTTKSFSTGYRTGEHHRPTYGVTACDVNGDGWPDLVVSAYGRQQNMLYLNNKGTFTEVGGKSGVAGDGNQNFNDNQFYRCYCKATNRCPIGVPAPTVQCPSRPPWNPGLDDHPVRLNGNTFTTVCGDLNNDGKMDLYHTEIRHWHIGQSSDPTQLLLNLSDPTRVFFRRLSPKDTGMERPKPPNWNQGDISAGFFDFDNDGRPDIYLANSDYPGTHGHLFRQVPSATKELPLFRDLAKMAGVAHARAAGLVLTDIDRDGDLDIIVGSSRARCKASEGCPWTRSEVRVYENLVGQNANWLQVRLEGKGKGGANRLGVGARLRVTAGGVTQTKEISGGYGHFGLHHGLVAHFGLGRSCVVDKIEIFWPNREGTVQTFTNVKANVRITLREGVDSVVYQSAR